MTDSERIAWVAAVVLFVGFAYAIAIGAGLGSSSRNAYSRGYAAAVDSARAVRTQHEDLAAILRAHGVKYDVVLALTSERDSVVSVIHAGTVR